MSRKKTKLDDPSHDDMMRLFFAALRSTDNLVLILGDSSKGFSVYPKAPPPAEFVALTHAHSDRLRALLDKPVMLAVHWGNGDQSAIVQVVPVDLKSGPNEKFVEFKLPFPDRKPVLMM